VDSRIYWIALNQVKGIGAARFKVLVDYFGDPCAVWEAPPRALQSIGLPANVVEDFLKVRSSLDIDALSQKIQAIPDLSVLTWEDDHYPHRLKQIPNPPPVVYLRGKLAASDDWAVAVVGTRRVSPYGQQVAEMVASFLARNGVTVVSGLALGVDSIAHRAALDAGGRTIAVLGSGVDHIYPSQNSTLAGEMLASGAVISEFGLGTRPDRGNFPARNRIISGLSLATVVVEAGEKSGDLITASFAADQGREVFAVPGKIFDPQSKGTNQLIRKGAYPLLAPEDLLEALNLTLITEQQSARVVLPADATEAAIFDVLGHEPMHIDEIGQHARLPIDQVSATLALMELKGMVRQLGHMQYVAAREVQASYQVGEPDRHEDEQ
jgi:DNA processing protein